LQNPNRVDLAHQRKAVASVFYSSVTADGETISDVFENKPPARRQSSTFTDSNSDGNCFASSLFPMPSVARRLLRYNALVPEVKPFRLTESVKAAG